MVRTSPRKTKLAAVSVEKATATATATSKASATNGAPEKLKSAKAAMVAKLEATKIVAKSVTKRKTSAEDAEDYEPESSEEKPKPAKKLKTGAGKTKGKKGKEDDMKVLAPRTAVGSLKRAMYIGAHVSAAGGVQNSIQNALQIGANSFALFLKSQRKWNNPQLDPTVRDQYIKLSAQASYDSTRHVLPHGSYLVNLAQADADKASQAYTSFVDDLQRCDALGIRLYNFHPGNSGGEDKKVACARIAERLNKAHAETKSVVTVLENMAGTGNTLGARFEELRDIIQGVKDKGRVAVCLDTCHAFAAGYDLRTKEAFDEMVKSFDDIVGLKYLKAFHLNDSKAPLGSNRDLHANIGTGFLGLRAFHHIMNYPAFQGLPMVLETPIERPGPGGKMVEDKQVWADEIKLLEGLIGTSTESDEFKELEKRLQAEGASERAKIQDQVDRKAVKDKKKSGGKAMKRSKNVKSSDEDD